MSLDPTTRAYHELYERASETYRADIDAVVDAARHAIQARMIIRPANDDRAEVFVAAVVRYVEDSRRGDGGLCHRAYG